MVSTCVLETALFVEVFELPTPVSLLQVLASIRCDSGFPLLLWLLEYVLGQEQGLSLVVFQVIAEHIKELFVLAAGLRIRGQHSALTSWEAKKHLLGICMVGTLECRMSHVVSGDLLDQTADACLPPQPPQRYCVCEGTEANCKVGRWDNVNDNVQEILGLFPEVILPHWQMGISRSWAGRNCQQLSLILDKERLTLSSATLAMKCFLDFLLP